MRMRLPALLSLLLDHDFKILARQHQRTVAGAIAVLHEQQQVVV